MLTGHGRVGVDSITAAVVRTCKVNRPCRFEVPKNWTAMDPPGIRPPS